MSETANGAALGPEQKFGLVPGEESNECSGIQALAREKIRLPSKASEAVPRTHYLAVIAPINSVANQRAQLFWNWPFQFYGEIGDAEAGVELVWGQDGTRWAGIQTGVATPAMIGRRLV